MIGLTFVATIKRERKIFGWVLLSHPTVGGVQLFNECHFAKAVQK